MQNTRQEGAWHFNSLKVMHVVKTKKAKDRGEMGWPGVRQKEPCKLLKDSDLYLYL